MYPNTRNSFDAIKASQQSISHDRFIDSDWVIAVEGTTDVAFYGCFVDKSKIRVKPAKELENAYHKERDCRPLIIAFVKDKVRKGKHCYGIMDADYQLPKIDDFIHEYVIFTDANSLETMIIKYVGTEYFNDIIKDAIVSMFHRNQDEIKCMLGNIKNNLAKDSLKWAYYIGCLRKENEEKKLNLNFKEVKEKSDYLKGFLQSKDITNPEFEFKIEEFLNELIKNSKTQRSIDYLRECIKNYNEKNVWFICQGHDVFDFIDAIIRFCTKTQRAKSVPGWENSKLFQESKITKKIILKFKNSPLKKWFDKINEEKIH